MGSFQKPREHNSIHASTPLLNYAVLMCRWTRTRPRSAAGMATRNVSAVVVVHAENELRLSWWVRVCVRGEIKVLWSIWEACLCDALSDVAGGAFVRYISRWPLHIQSLVQIPSDIKLQTDQANIGERMCSFHQGGFIFLPPPHFLHTESDLNPKNIQVSSAVRPCSFAGADPGIVPSTWVRIHTYVADLMPNVAHSLTAPPPHPTSRPWGRCTFNGANGNNRDVIVLHWRLNYWSARIDTAALEYFFFFTRSWVMHAAHDTVTGNGG